jgi:HEAT repeat protein
MTRRSRRFLKHSNESFESVRLSLQGGSERTAVPALVELLEKDPSAKVREMAAFALGEIESINAADAILNALGSQAETRPVGSVSSVTARLVEAAGKIAAANPKHPKAAGARKRDR